MLRVMTVSHYVQGVRHAHKTLSLSRTHTHTLTHTHSSHTHFLHQRPVRYKKKKNLQSHTHVRHFSPKHPPTNTDYTETTQLSHWPTVRSYRFIKLMFTHAAETYLPSWLWTLLPGPLFSVLAGCDLAGTTPMQLRQAKNLNRWCQIIPGPNVESSSMRNSAWFSFAVLLFLSPTARRRHHHPYRSFSKQLENWAAVSLSA